MNCQTADLKMPQISNVQSRLTVHTYIKLSIVLLLVAFFFYAKWDDLHPSTDTLPEDIIVNDVSAALLDVNRFRVKNGRYPDESEFMHLMEVGKHQEFAFRWVTVNSQKEPIIIHLKPHGDLYYVKLIDSDGYYGFWLGEKIIKVLLSTRLTPSPEEKLFENKIMEIKMNPRSS